MRLLIISVLIDLALHVIPLSAKMSGDLPLTKEQIDQLDSSAKTIEQIGQLCQTSTPYLVLDKQLADRQLAILLFVTASARNSLGFCRSRSTSQQLQALRKDWLRLICRTNSAAWPTKQSKPEMNAWQVLLVESRSLYNYSFQRTVKNCAFQIPRSTNQRFY